MPDTSRTYLKFSMRPYKTNSLSCVVYYSGTSRNQNETLCVPCASQALTRRTRSISVISVLWPLSRGGHRGTTNAWVGNHSKSTLGPVRLNKNTTCEVQQRVGNWSLASLQQRSVKTGGRLVKHARYYWLLLAESHLTRRLFGAVVRRIEALPLPAGWQKPPGRQRNPPRKR